MPPKDRASSKSKKQRLDEFLRQNDPLAISEEHWRELATLLAGGPTQAYATAKRAIREAWGAPWPDVLAAEARDQAALGATADHRGAVEAFLAKRRPEFTGRE